MPHLSLQDQVTYMRKSWTHLLERIRRNFRRLEYFCALEFTKRHTPHLHILTRGEYIPQQWLSSAWLQLTGSFKVDIRRVDRTPAAISEATKYLLKTAHQVALAAPGRRVYTMSRAWLPDDWDFPDQDTRRFKFVAWTTYGVKDCLFFLRRWGVEVSVIPDTPGSYSITFPPNLDHRPIDEALMLGDSGAAALASAVLAILSPAAATLRDLADFNRAARYEHTPNRRYRI